MLRTSHTFQRWLETLGLKGPDFLISRCRTEKEYREYWELAVSQMLTSRYGLQTVRALPTSFRRYHSHLVSTARTPDSTLLAAFRLIPNYDLRRFANFFDPMVIKALRPKTVLGASNYYTPLVTTKIRQSIFHEIFADAVLQARSHGAQLIYGEARPKQAKLFESFGWQILGKRFQVKGWTGSYVPIGYWLQ